jgi:hypothetical protein
MSSAPSSAAVFVKGLRAERRRVWTQQREAEVGPYVQAVAPRVLWHIETAGWNLVAFEHIDGRHSDYTPTPTDLPLVVDALERLGAIPCPDLPLRIAEQRWSAYLEDPSMLDHLRGNALLHTDFNNLNVLIADDLAPSFPTIFTLAAPAAHRCQNSAHVHVSGAATPALTLELPPSPRRWGFLSRPRDRSRRELGTTVQCRSSEEWRW